MQNRRFVIVPFSATTLGVRIGSLAYNLAEAVTVLAGSGDGDEPASLSSVQFSEVSLAETQARQAVGKSGAMVYTRLPTYGGVDLETFCPGSATNVFITSDADRVPAPTDAPQDVDSSGAAGFHSSVWGVVAGAVLWILLQ